MFGKKCLLVFMLLAIIKFSQNSAAPLENENAAIQEDSINSESKEMKSMSPERKEIDSVASTEFQPYDSELPPKILSREEELELLKKIPEFCTIAKSLEELPLDVYHDIRHFLHTIIPRMPINNVATIHLQNASIMMELFERVIRVANEGDAKDVEHRRKLIKEVHRAVPQLHFEMNFMKDFIKDVKSQLPQPGNVESQTEEEQTNGEGGQEIQSNEEKSEVEVQSDEAVQPEVESQINNDKGNIEDEVGEEQEKIEMNMNEDESSTNQLSSE